MDSLGFIAKCTVLWGNCISLRVKRNEAEREYNELLSSPQLCWHLLHLPRSPRHWTLPSTPLPSHTARRQAGAYGEQRKSPPVSNKHPVYAGEFADHGGAARTAGSSPSSTAEREYTEQMYMKLCGQLIEMYLLFLQVFEEFKSEI